MMTTHYVTSDRESPLFEFNFLCVHPECVDDWTRRDDYMRAIDDLERAGGWERKPWVPRRRTRPT